MFAVISKLFQFWALTYQGSCLNVMLVQVHGLDPQTSTLVYLVGSLGFILGTQISGQILNRQLMSRRGLTYLGCLLVALGMFT